MPVRNNRILLPCPYKTTSLPHFCLPKALKNAEPKKLFYSSADYNDRLNSHDKGHNFYDKGHIFSDKGHNFSDNAYKI